MSTAELTCEELVELVTEYVEGTLSADDQTRFERHLSICPGCRTYLEQFRETIAITGEHARRFTVEGRGERWAGLMRRLSKDLA